MKRYNIKTKLEKISYKFLLTLAGIVRGKKFTGLFDADGSPLFDGDKYKLFHTTEAGNRLPLGGKDEKNKWEPRIHTVKYEVIDYGVHQQAGYFLKKQSMIKKV